jgi:hypothetical protein
MRKLLLLTFFAIGLGLNAEAQKMNSQRMELMKANFITNQLDLTPEEAQMFWPVYNKYNKIIRASKNQLDRGLIQSYLNGGTIDALTEEQAEQFLKDVQQHEKAILEAKQAMANDLKGIISSHKIVKLMKAENDFNRRILRELGRRRGQARPQ